MTVEESTGIQIARQRSLGHCEEVCRWDRLGHSEGVCRWDQYVGLDGRMRGQRVPVRDRGPALGTGLGRDSGNRQVSAVLSQWQVISQPPLSRRDGGQPC